MDKTYELRSDTFTLPTEGMRRAIYSAEVGDDVYREDKSVERLEKMAAEITGKESALFVSSGCMGNLIPLMIKGGLGKEVIAAKESHIARHEIGAVTSIARTLPVYAVSDRGILDAESVKSLLHPYAYDMSEPSMIEVENTTSGLIYPIETLKAIKKIAEENSLWVHMDGARIFNASVKTKISVKEYAENADDITFCLSKGLGAPMGSLLSGDKDFIEEARRVRKILGGGLRQSGFMAAAGIYALEHNIERLEDDDMNREIISSALEKTGFFDISISSTNMIFFKPLLDKEKTLQWFRKRNILILEDGGFLRAVTNLNLSNKDAEEVGTLISEMKEEELR